MAPADTVRMTMARTQATIDGRRSVLAALGENAYQKRSHQAELLRVWTRPRVERHARRVRAEHAPLLRRVEALKPERAAHETSLRDEYGNLAATAQEDARRRQRPRPLKRKTPRMIQGAHFVFGQLRG
jgi:hypothetical protein